MKKRIYEIDDDPSSSVCRVTIAHHFLRQDFGRDVPQTCHTHSFFIFSFTVAFRVYGGCLLIGDALRESKGEAREVTTFGVL
jgi:hypothetical protein